ncbi:hypothetical protein CEXT_174791 [Caerostris extrusa]|uniref:Uncharacterized protein n=1 Tax=Caerostris extrusa TaxID=172846 RepID=A0AAV4UJY4_CAEEX|nr:hypothetical protein CEXT_174791 [Caerostris extrusa]
MEGTFLSRLSSSQPTCMHGRKKYAKNAFLKHMWEEIMQKKVERFALLRVCVCPLSPNCCVGDGIAMCLHTYDYEDLILYDVYDVENGFGFGG